MKNYNQRNQAILIRDMIDMYREHSLDTSIIEYLSNFAFNMARIVEENNIKDRQLDWNILFSFLDQKYQQTMVIIDETKINTLYNKSNEVIKSYEVK
jgi:hypothetical protein